MNAKPAIILEGASKTYSIAKKEVNALMNVTLEVPLGRCCMLVGPSGSGKTTLLNLAALLTRPSAGRVVLFGKDTNSLGEYGLDRLRRQFIGVVFQAFNLLGGLNVLDNVTLPLVPRGMGPKKRKEAGMATLERLGLGGFAALRAEQLSGGEQQRVAIARALVGDPSLMIADEPTSNLDEENVLAILEILAKLKEEGKTLLLSSHDARVLEGGLADTVVRLKNGALQSLAAKG
jgi:putative ABC transport system ATP-binding protein